MAAYEHLLTEKDQGVGYIVLNRPQALNALNTQVLTELKACAQEMENDKEIRAVIITGSGEKSFVAGADISEMLSKTSAEGEAMGALGQNVFATIEQLKKPVIAAINGFALGGGCELAMACDIRIAAKRAKFGQPEVNIGVIPGFGGTQRLPRLVGMGAAKLMILSARMVNADEALRIGLVDMVTENDDLLDEAKKLALEIASKSPNALSVGKQTINAGCEKGLTESIAYEAKMFGACFGTAEQKEGMGAFLEKRPAKF